MRIQKLQAQLLFKAGVTSVKIGKQLRDSESRASKAGADVERRDSREIDASVAGEAYK